MRIFEPMKENLSNDIAKGLLKTLAVLLLAAVFVWFLRRVYPVIIYVVVAMVLSLLGRPVKHWLMRFKMSNLLASLLVLLMFAVVFALFFVLFVPMLLQQAENFSNIDTDTVSATLQQSLASVNDFLGRHHITPVKPLSLADMIKKLDLSLIPHLISQIISMLSHFAVAFFSVLFIGFFLIKEDHLVSRQLFRLIPDSDEEKYRRVIDKIKHLLRTYIGGLMADVSVLFVIYNISLHLIGIRDATIIAFLAALLNVIPYVGPLIGLTLMMVLSITSQLNAGMTNIDFSPLKYILLMYVAAQMLDAFVFQPFIYSKSVKSHPLEIFLVILSTGYLFGMWGMLIAVPSYTILKILFREFYVEYSRDFISW